MPKKITTVASPSHSIDTDFYDQISLQLSKLRTLFDARSALIDVGASTQDVAQSMIEIEFEALGTAEQSLESWCSQKKLYKAAGGEA